MNDAVNHGLTYLNMFFGGSGILGFILAWNERKVKQKLDESKALAAMQEVYQQFVTDTRDEIKKLKEEIKHLNERLEKADACTSCPNLKK